MAFNLYFGFGLNIYTNHQWATLFPIEKEVVNKESVIIEVSKKGKTDTVSLPPAILPVAEKGKQVIYFQNKNLGNLNVYYGQKAELMPLKSLREKSEALLLNWGLAALLHQKGYLVLRGTHLLVAGKSVMFMGNEKDQHDMTQYCIHCGGKVISENISVISFHNDEPYMIPSCSRKTGSGNLPFLMKEIRLDSICFLNAEANEKPGLMSKFEAFKKVFYGCYLKLESKHENVMVVHFRNIEKLLNKINIYQLKPWLKASDIDLATACLSALK